MDKLNVGHTHAQGLAWMVIKLPVEMQHVQQLLGPPPSALLYDVKFVTRPQLSMLMQNWICRKARIADSWD